MKEKQNAIMQQRTTASVSLELVSPRPKKEFGFIDIYKSSRTTFSWTRNFNHVLQNGEQNRF
jgi:hypothetical protein